MTPSVLIVGGSGWLGRQVLRGIPRAHTLAAADVLNGAEAAVREALGAADDAVMVNASGARMGARAELDRWNVAVPETLARVCAERGAHLVHLGSAAEYGTGQPGGLCLESAEPVPESDYGRSKLSGTLAALTAGSATVLRVFNVAACPPQVGSPLADVVDRTREALVTRAPARLLSPGTVRDWVMPQFVAASAVFAAHRRPLGVFNLCSGIGVPIGAAVAAALRSLGLDAGVEPGDAPGGPVVGDPRRWFEASGLAESLSVEDLARVIARNVEGLAPGAEGIVGHGSRARA